LVFFVSHTLFVLHSFSFVGPMSARDDELFRLSSALQAKYHTPLLTSALTFSQLAGNMTSEERTQTALAFNATFARYVCSLEALRSRSDAHTNPVVTEMLSHVTKALHQSCESIRHVIETDLLPNALAAENHAFWHLYQINIMRLLFVHCHGAEKELNIRTLREKYQECNEECRRKLPPLSVTRLGAAVNFGTFLSEYLGTEHSKRFAAGVISDLHAEGGGIVLPEDVKVLVRFLYILANEE